MPSKRDLRAAADALRRILEALERGELDAPPSLAQRLDGAARALEALSKPSPPVGGVAGQEEAKSQPPG